MNIRWHHVKYAAANSVRVFALFAILNGIVAVTKGADLMIGLVLGVGIGAVMTLPAFLYLLWRTQRRLPMTDKKPKKPTS